MNAAFLPSSYCSSSKYASALALRAFTLSFSSCRTSVHTLMASVDCWFWKTEDWQGQCLHCFAAQSSCKDPVCLSVLKRSDWMFYLGEAVAVPLFGMCGISRNVGLRFHHCLVFINGVLVPRHGIKKKQLTVVLLHQGFWLIIQKFSCPSLAIKRLKGEPTWCSG